jgi:hypothetical protein
MRGYLIFTTVFFVICTSLASARQPFEYFVEFCSIGERVPGTSGHDQARDYIVSSLKEAEVDTFKFLGTDYYNIYRRFPGAGPRIALAAHWDSDVGCPGANDGGSGVAILLSLADTLEKNQPKQAVDLLFFDGEDVEKAELLGSKHFAANCVDDYGFIIVLDMVGDKDLQIFKEGNSAKFFPDFVDSIWAIGSAIAPNVFFPHIKYYIVDDHISLIRYGMRAINVIDFDYPYWDTSDDTADKCSRESLDIMYRFALSIVYQQSVY